MEDENFLDVPFVGIPNTSWKNSFDVPISLEMMDLDVYEFRIWCHLARRGAKNGEAWPSYRTMAKELRMSQATINRTIKSLVARRLLKVTARVKDNGSATSNLYVALAPEQHGQEGECFSTDTTLLPNRGEGASPQIPAPPSVEKRKLLKGETLKNEIIPPFIPPRGDMPSAPAKKKIAHAARPENLGEVQDFVIERLKLTDNDAVALWEHWCGNGFKNNGKAMASWKHVASNWERRRIFFPSLQNKNQNFGFAK